MRTPMLAVLPALVAFLATACGTISTAGPTVGSTTSEPATPGPATPESTVSADDQALPAPVAEMRDEVLAAARTDDYERLAELGLEGRFTASFGGDFEDPQELTRYWRHSDDGEGPDVDDVLIGLLGLTPYITSAHDAAGDEVTIYVWPRAQSDDASDADRQQLEERFGEARVAGWYADGMYLGWRLGITEEGDWQFFVAGD